MDAQVAAAAYSFAARHRSVLIHYVWDLPPWRLGRGRPDWVWHVLGRSEEHTSELQSRLHLVCRLLLEKKKNRIYINTLTDTRPLEENSASIFLVASGTFIR